MDPNATLRLLADALENDDRMGAYEALANIARWLANGGFSPSVVAWGSVVDAAEDAVSRIESARDDCEE